MLVDIVDLSSDDDEVAVTEEHSVDGKGVYAKANFFDLTIDDGILEGEHIAYEQEQGDSAQGTSFYKQEFIADDGQAEAAQCIVTLELQNLGADGGCYASQCTETLLVQQLRRNDGQNDAAHSTGTLPIQELRTDGGQHDAAQCTTSLHMQELRATDVQGDAACFTPTLQRQEHTAGNEQGDTVQYTTTQQGQESIADDTRGDFTHCTTALQWQGSHKAQCTTTLLRQEFLAAGDRMQDAALLRNSAEATTSLTSTQQGRHMRTELFNVSTATPFPRQFWKAGEKAGDYGLASQADLNSIF
jgi:hypothetical protein